MRIKRADRNQPEIVKALRQVPGVEVAHVHTVGDGMVDILVGFRGVNYMFEIKDPEQPKSKRKLTPDEEVFHSKWTGQIAVIETVEDALKIAFGECKLDMSASVSPY